MAQNIVVDSSVVVKWLNQDKELLLKQADKLLNHCLENRVILYAPDLLKYEVGNALLYKKMPVALIKTGLNVLHQIPLNFVSEDVGLSYKTAQIAKKNNITYYDACFISLANVINAELVTANPKHQRVPTKTKVIPLEEY